MLEGTTAKDRLIAAAMALAVTRPWRELSLAEIATHAGVPLVEAQAEFKSKSDILAAFTREVDLEVMRRFPRLTGDAPRDRLFDVILTRFEILGPYKPALRNIVTGFGYDVGAAFRQLVPAIKSQYWMLATAGIGGEGPMGLLRIKGLLGVYGRVFKVWLDDDDPGLAKTMATLDKHLRRGEDVIVRLNKLRAGVERVCAAITGKPVPEEPTTGATTPPSGPQPSEPSPSI